MMNGLIRPLRILSTLFIIIESAHHPPNATDNHASPRTHPFAPSPTTPPPPQPSLPLPISPLRSRFLSPLARSPSSPPPHPPSLPLPSFTTMPRSTNIPRTSPPPPARPHNAAHSPPSNPLSSITFPHLSVMNGGLWKSEEAYCPQHFRACADASPHAVGSNDNCECCLRVCEICNGGTGKEGSLEISPGQADPAEWNDSMGTVSPWGREFAGVHGSQLWSPASQSGPVGCTTVGDGTTANLAGWVAGGPAAPVSTGGSTPGRDDNHHSPLPVEGSIDANLGGSALPNGSEPVAAAAPPAGTPQISLEDQQMVASANNPADTPLTLQSMSAARGGDGGVGTANGALEVRVWGRGGLGRARLLLFSFSHLCHCPCSHFGHVAFFACLHLFCSATNFFVSLKMCWV